MAVYYPDGGPGAYAQNQQGRQDDQFREILKMMMLGMQEKTRKQQYTDQLQQQQVENQFKEKKYALDERGTVASEKNADARMISASRPTPEPEWKFKVKWIASLKDPKEQKKAVNAFLGIADKEMTPWQKKQDERYRENRSYLDGKLNRGEITQEQYDRSFYGIIPESKTGTLKLAEELVQQGAYGLTTVPDAMEKIMNSSSTEQMRMLLEFMGMGTGESTPGTQPNPDLGGGSDIPPGWEKVVIDGETILRKKK